MERIKDFARENEVDIVNNKLSEEKLQEILGLLCFKAGEQLTEFLENYSYLAYGDVEFFGINSVLQEKSPMVMNTCLLNNNYETTKGYFVVERMGDGIYVLVDSDDNVYKFFAGDSKAPEKTEFRFFDYILRRFSEAVI